MAGDAELDELMAMLKAMAMQPTTASSRVGPPVTLIQEQLATIATARAAGQRVFTLTQKGDHGYNAVPLLSVDLTESAAATPYGSGQPLPPTDWIPTGGFMTVGTDVRLKVVGPFPSLLLLGSTGRFNPGSDGGEIEGPGYMSVQYLVNAVVFAGGDQEAYTQRSSLILASAFLRTVRLDETLGGLVQSIRPLGPIEPGGGGRYGTTPSVMASRIRFEAFANLPY